jgi:cell division protein ZapA
MSNVNLAIGGRTFTVACANGEEGHVAELGSMIDAKVTASGAISQNETRMLLFAALMLADEVHEVNAELAQARASSDRGGEADAQLEARIEQITRRIEALAQDLEAQDLEDTATSA